MERSRGTLHTMGGEGNINKQEQHGTPDAILLRFSNPSIGLRGSGG